MRPFAGSAVIVGSFVILLGALFSTMVSAWLPFVLGAWFLGLLLVARALFVPRNPIRERIILATLVSSFGLSFIGAALGEGAGPLYIAALAVGVGTVLVVMSELTGASQRP